MTSPGEPQLIQGAAELLVQSGLLEGDAARQLTVDPTTCRAMAADGSSRRFRRLGKPGGESWILVAPAGQSPAELAESRAAWHIANHLFSRGVPVPRPYGWDEALGLLLFEDLGDLRLHDIVAAEVAGQRHPAGEAAPFYRQALDQLALMQCRGAQGFEPKWCWDTPRYDLALMIARESNYFLDAFWQGLLGREIPPAVTEELQAVAELAAAAPADFFLHRDFQSRNIMVKGGAVRFIDFQGGRLGPLGYDPASLLIDPYAGLSAEQQEELLSGYILALSNLCPINQADFRRHYRLLALQRNLQIIGAFAYLSRVRGKPFFRVYLAPAVDSLAERLDDPLFSSYRALRSLVAAAREEVVPYR